MKVNVGASGTARLIMRNKGNFRLLLNASIWPGMKVTPMEGGKVSLKSQIQAHCLHVSQQRFMSSSHDAHLKLRPLRAFAAPAAHVRCGEM